MESNKGEKMSKKALKIQPSITDSLPDLNEAPKTKLIQIEIDIDLYNKVMAKKEQLRKQKKVTWKALFEITLRRWLEEG